MAETKNTKLNSSKETKTKTTSKSTVAKKTPTKTKTISKSAVAKKTTAKKTVSKSSEKKVEEKTIKKTTRKRKTPVKKIVSSTKKEFVDDRVKDNNEVIKKDLCIVSIFKDIISLYKNFLHWNLSKFVIYFWSLILGLIVSLPFFVIYSFSKDVALTNVYIDFLGSVSLSNIELIFTNLFYFFQSIFYSIILILSGDYLSILYIIGGLFFLFGFLYSYPLLINLSNSYLDGKKISIKENDYFNIKKIIDFSLLSLLNLFVISLYIVLFSLILFGISYLLSLFAGSGLNLGILLESGELNYASGSMISYLLVAIIGFIYLFFRIVFSYFYLSDKDYNKEPKKVLSYFKQSFISTKGFKLFCKFIFLNFISIVAYFLILLLFVYLVSLTGITENIALISVTIFSFIFFYGLFVTIYGSFFKREINK